MPLEPGKQLGKYRIIRLVAQGGMAEVYKAEQELAAGFMRPCALKVIRPEYTESPEFREMFLDEARTASTLSHPNIVHIYDVGEIAGTLYMAMELVPGETLANVSRTLREAGRRFSNEAIVALGVYTCSALEAVHALKLPGEGHVNLVHRDVSPHNLLLSSNGSLKLIDFGIAKALTNKNLTMPGVTKGKAGYFSPEQAMGKPLDGRSDLFSLGITLYKLASGFTPFDQHKTHHSRNSALVHGRWEPLEHICKGLPRGLYDVIGKSMQLRPEERYRDAREMREELERVALESRVQIGQSALTGYVNDDGEISSTPSQKMAVVRPPSTTPDSALPRLATKRGTEKLVPNVEVAGGEASSRRWLWALGLIAGLAVLAAGSGLWLWLSAPSAPTVVAIAPTAPGNKPVKTTEDAKASPAAGPTETKKASAEGVGTKESAEGAGTKESVEGAGTKDSAAPAEVREAREPTKVAAVDVRPRPSPRLKVAPSPVSKPPVPAAIPRGEGRLRINVKPEGVVSVGRESWGATPVDRKLNSGEYVVSITSPTTGRRATCQARVYPDRTTKLIYSFDSNTCQTPE